MGRCVGSDGSSGRGRRLLGGALTFDGGDCTGRISAVHLSVCVTSAAPQLVILDAKVIPLLEHQPMHTCTREASGEFLQQLVLMCFADVHAGTQRVFDCFSALAQCCKSFRPQSVDITAARPITTQHGACVLLLLLLRYFCTQNLTSHTTDTSDNELAFATYDSSVFAESAL